MNLWPAGLRIGKAPYNSVQIEVKDAFLTMSFKPWSFSSLLRLRCPACGADTFRSGIFRTARECGACGQVFEREGGFYAGAIYPMYAGAVLLGGIGVLLGMLMGLSYVQGMVLTGLLVLFASPWLFWFARLSFLHTDHRFFGENT